MSENDKKGDKIKGNQGKNISERLKNLQIYYNIKLTIKTFGGPEQQPDDDAGILFFPHLSKTFPRMEIILLQHSWKKGGQSDG